MALPYRGGRPYYLSAKPPTMYVWLGVHPQASKRVPGAHLPKIRHRAWPAVGNYYLKEGKCTDFG